MSHACSAVVAIQHPKMEYFGFIASYVRDGVTKSALELTSYKLDTLVICVSSNFLCAVLCKILRYHLRSHVILHFNKHITISCIFVFSLFDLLCPEAVPVCPGPWGKLKYFSKNKTYFTNTNVYFIEHCTLTS